MTLPKIPVGVGFPLYKGVEYINDAIEAADKAQQDSANAKVMSENAETTANSVQEQFNQVVIEGDSSVEAAQARVDAEGNSFTTLKDRLDNSDALLSNEKELRRKSKVSPEEYGAVGDGVTDDVLAIEQAFADNRKIEFLSDKYYISRAINFVGYKKLTSKHISTEIMINVDDYIFHGKADADKAYIEADNFTLTNSSGLSTKAAIHLEGTTVAPYVGARYSNFKGFTINGFYDGIYAFGFWDTNFEKIRVNNPTRASIVLGSTSNNIRIDGCMLLGGQHAVIGKSTIGGTSIQLTSIHVQNCDLGSQSGWAFDLYKIQKITIDKCHVENVSKLVSEDNVAGLTISDCRLHGIVDLLEHKKSDTSAPFKGVPTIRDNLIYVNSSVDIGLIYLTTDSKVDLRDNTIINESTGKVYMYKNNMSSTALMDVKKRKTFETVGKRFRYTADNFDYTFDLSNEREKYVKLTSAKLVCTEAGTATSSTTVSVAKDGVTLYQGSIGAIAYTAEQEIGLSLKISSAYQRIIVEDGSILNITHSNTTGGETPKFKLVFQNVPMSDIV